MLRSLMLIAPELALELKKKMPGFGSWLCFWKLWNFEDSLYPICQMQKVPFLCQVPLSGLCQRASPPGIMGMPLRVGNVSVSHG